MAVIFKNQPFSKSFLPFGMNDNVRINMFLLTNFLVICVAKPVSFSSIPQE